MRPRVRFTARGNIAVTGNPLWRKRRILCHQYRGHAEQARILDIGKGPVIAAFQLDPDGKLITPFPPLVRGLPRMPGHPVKGNILRNRARTVNQQMSRDTQRCNLREKRMLSGIQPIEKQLIDMTAPELAGRQADIVDHQQFRLHPLWPLGLVGRIQLSGTGQAVLMHGQFHVVSIAQLTSVMQCSKIAAIGKPWRLDRTFMQAATLPDDMTVTAQRALEEDVGCGDLTAMLIPEHAQTSGRILCREKAVLCGTAWAEAVATLVDRRIVIEWLATDGDLLRPDQHIARLKGPARSLLTAERCMLNFLQTLSGTATVARDYAERVAHTGVRLLDTRKTLPGLRTAQKYAVRTGGCGNHRMGLYDAFLIKENHISACGSITAAVEQARRVAADRPVEVEVETRAELEEALTAGADIVMLDNFTPAQLRDAVSLNQGRSRLEASGGITDDTLVEVAETGVDHISIGALTKHCHAIDLSFRLDDVPA